MTSRRRPKVLPWSMRQCSFVAIRWQWQLQVQPRPQKRHEWRLVSVGAKVNRRGRVVGLRRPITQYTAEDVVKSVLSTSSITYGIECL